MSIFCEPRCRIIDVGTKRRDSHIPRKVDGRASVSVDLPKLAFRRLSTSSIDIDLRKVRVMVMSTSGQ